MLLVAAPQLTAAGIAIASHRGSGQFGGALLAVFNPVLPFAAIAAALYGVGRFRRTEPLRPLLWAAIVTSLVFVYPLASYILPALGQEHAFVGLKQYPFGFAIFYASLGIGASVIVYDQLRWRRKRSTPARALPGP